MSIAGLYSDLKNLIKQFSYSKEEVDDKIGDIDEYITSTHSNIYPSEVVDSVTDNDMRPVTSNAVYEAIDEVGSPDLSGYVTTNDSRLSDSRTPLAHEHNTGEVKDTSAYTNIGSSANATQKTINDKINTKLGVKADASNVYGKSETYTQSEITTLISNAVSNLSLFEVVNTLPTTNIKNNRLYLIVNGENISENNYDIYLRVNNAWEQLDAFELDISNFYDKDEVDSLLSGKVDSSDSRLSDSRTPKSHSHGNITNTGAVGSSANLPLITTTNGVVTTGSFGTGANTFCQGNDSRLSDSRTPVSHATSGTTYGVGSASNYGHVKASSSTPAAISTSSGSVGTDNGLYARADHTHKITVTYSAGKLTIS